MVDYKESLVKASRQAKVVEAEGKQQNVHRHESQQVSVADFNASNEAWRKKVQQEISRKLEQSQQGSTPFPS